MKKLIPFKFMPSSWGLQGKPYEEAEANYYYEGYALEERLAEINFEGKDLEKKKADILKKYEIIDEYDWMKKHIILDIEDTTEQSVELIKLDIEFKKIEKNDGEKQIANILQEPWVSIVDEGLDPNKGPSGFFFEFDWNDHWIDMLRANGYEGLTEEDIMEKWFTDVCRNEVIQSSPIPFNSSIVYD